jgi:hypothetical protein
MTSLEVANIHRDLGTRRALRVHAAFLVLLAKCLLVAVAHRHERDSLRFCTAIPAEHLEWEGDRLCGWRRVERGLGAGGGVCGPCFRGTVARADDYEVEANRRDWDVLRCNVELISNFVTSTLRRITLTASATVKTAMSRRTTKTNSMMVVMV